MNEQGMDWMKIRRIWAHRLDTASYLEVPLVATCWVFMWVATTFLKLAIFLGEKGIRAGWTSWFVGPAFRVFFWLMLRIGDPSPEESEVRL